MGSQLIQTPDDRDQMSKRKNLLTSDIRHLTSGNRERICGRRRSNAVIQPMA
jgi:hypothetical protein